ncbi:hypothetical protein BGX27_002025, partial [Mortierella sp. AM989]
NTYWRFDVRADHGDNGYGPVLISILEKFKGSDCQAIFIPSSSQLVLSMNGKIQVWNLSANESRPCELSLVWRYSDVFTRVASGQACEHSFRLLVDRKTETNEQKGACGDGFNTLTVPLSVQDTISIKEDVRLTKGILSLLDDYAGGDKTYKEEVIQYLKSHLRPTLKHQESSLIVLCKAWTVESKSDIEFIIQKLLPADRVTWIPDASSMKNSADPLSIILNFAKSQPSAIYTAKIIMDYYVNHAIRSRNLAFLNPFFRSLYQVMDLAPQVGLLRLGRIAYIPAMNRPHIMDNHIIAHPPNWQFWKKNSTPLNKIKDPIMQLHISGSKADPTDDLFTRPVFMASFDTLWCYRDKVLPATVAESNEGSFMSTMEETRTTWWKILYHLIRLKCCLRIHNFVECYDFYDFKLEFYGNPAVAALVAYKWNTIGFKYWLIQFSDILVTCQILESSEYNFFKVFAFCLPMAASGNQLANIYQENKEGYTFLLSFSVLAVFLHMLFELRVNKSVCKYVTNIHYVFAEIRVFAIIFAVGVFAFTVATLHLLRACSYEGCEVPGPEKGLPENFFHAMSVIYFFMSGRWDPVSEYFKSGNWAFRSISKAFDFGDDAWLSVWVEVRLRYIESAENLSYHIPGFRQTYGWFPKEIYFSSSLQKVQEFREKYQGTKAESNLEALKGWIRSDDKRDDYPEEDGENSEVNTVKKSKKHNEEKCSDAKVEQLDVANPVSDSKGGDVPEENGFTTSSSATVTVTMLSLQVIDLKSQVRDLQKQLVTQLATQQEQVQRQLALQQEQVQRQFAVQQGQAQRQHEEIMNLLSLLRQ